MRNQLDSGLTCGAETELSVKVSEKLNGMIPCAEMIRFASQGTEAVISRSNPRLRSSLTEMCEEMGVSARLNGPGGQFQVHFTSTDTGDYRGVVAVSQERFMRFQ